MKKIYTILVAILAITQFSYAQWTGAPGDIYYNTGKVGIGTTSPAYKLSVSNGGANGLEFDPTSLSGAQSVMLSYNRSAGVYTPLTFYSSQFRFDNANVGIGVAPSSKLTVMPNTGNFSQQFNIDGAAPNGAVDDITLGFNSYGGSATAPLRVNTSRSAWTISPRNSATDIYSALYINYTTAAGTNYRPFVISGGSTAANSSILLASSGGNVGIGTISPESTLSVYGGNVSVQNNLSVGGADGNGIKFYGNMGSVPYRSASIVPYVPASAPGVDHVGLKIYTANGVANIVNALTIDDTGNVGIGTATPREALSVNGNIRSRQVKVETANWPDYVFKPAYALPSLLEVKTYIDQNHHLPDMPSEQEVKENGLNLGEINMQLTKKVEELTLYLIEQSKQMSHQQKSIALLQKQVNSLKKHIN